MLLKTAERTEEFERNIALDKYAHLDSSIDNPDYVPDPDEPPGYDAWYRAKMQEAFDDPRPSIPHEQVMREMQEFLDRKEREQNQRRMEPAGAY